MTPTLETLLLNTHLHGKWTFAIEDATGAHFSDELPYQTKQQAFEALVEALPTVYKPISGNILYVHDNGKTGIAYPVTLSDEGPIIQAGHLVWTSKTDTLLSKLTTVLTLLMTTLLFAKVLGLLP